MSSMYIIKRDGRRESVHFDKITSRISKLCYGLNPKVGFLLFPLSLLVRLFIQPPRFVFCLT